VILSKTLSKKYFGNENSIGQTLIVNFDQQYIVSGILEDYPRNSYLSSELIFPINSQPTYADNENDWGTSWIFTVVQLESGTSSGALEAKFPDLIKKLWNEEVQQRTSFRLLPLKATFETFVGDPKDVYILLFVGIGLVLIVTINFVNLSTARTLDRSKEVSMRKVFGARKGQLIHQFLYESIIMSFVALVTSIIAAKLLIPFVNQRFELQLVLDLTNLNTYLLLLGTTLLLGIVAGSIPSIILSGLQIQRALKSFKEDKVQLRNILVTVQFGLSMILLIGVAVIGKQINFMRSAELGFEAKNQIIIPISVNDFEDAEEAVTRLQSFKDIIAKHSAVKGLTSSRHIPFNWSGSNIFVQPEGWQDDPLRMRFTYHDADFFPTYGIKLLDGPGFKDDAFGDQRESVIINEAALRAFGWDNIKDKT
ncbi:MAG: FtsX-like permease family protein, partial [Cyclobacteriaceae bacterium]